MAQKQAKRDTYKYQFIRNGRANHSGFARDPKRREAELKRKYGAGHLRKVGRRTTRDAAKEWERGRPSAGRAGP